MIAYAKSRADGSEVVVCIDNLDPQNVQSGWVTLPLDDFGLQPRRAFQQQSARSAERLVHSAGMASATSSAGTRSAALRTRWRCGRGCGARTT